MPQAHIIDFQFEHTGAFRDLNIAWIRQHWEPQQGDYEALMPGTIIAEGGCIVLAELAGDIVGTGALLKHADSRYELAKITIASFARGNGIGEALVRALIRRAREMAAQTVFLECNSDWTAAIRLYEKLGFRHLEEGCSARAQCNVRMTLSLLPG